MPTRGSYTDFRRADGYIPASTKPLGYNGNIIEGIKVTFGMDKSIDITALEWVIRLQKDLVFENAGARAWVRCGLVRIQGQFLDRKYLLQHPLR